MPELGWVVQLLGALVTAHFAATVFSGRGKEFTRLALASGLVALVGALGAGWVVHPAAGMLLAFVTGWLGGGTRRWGRHLPTLGVTLLSAAAFVWLGAGWLLLPLSILLMITALSSVNNAGRPAKGAEAAPPAPLPEAGAGLPASPVIIADAVPVEPAHPRPVPVAQAAPAPTSGLAALHHDERLPAEARALLVAIDYRTAEALRALTTQGQTGTRAAYEARAIHEEYAPAAVRAYLNLPPTRADSTPLEGQKTGRDLLIKQLELLLAAAQALVDASTRSGGQALLSNGRFLREKFGQLPPDEQDLKLK